MGFFMPHKLAKNDGQSHPKYGI